MNKHLSTSIFKILKPIIGLMFRNHVAFGDFSKLVKQAYIEVTEKEIIALGQKATTSRIAIITGLTRKDVAALRKDVAAIKREHLATGLETVKSPQQNRATRVISGWISDSAFSDDQGQALPLCIQGSEGSFEALVGQYSGDMPYRAMLDELVRTGAVEVTSDGIVNLVRAAYIPSDSENEKYDVLGEDVSQLITTIQHNMVMEDESALFQRKVCYDRIPVEYIDEFKQLAAKENQRLLMKLNGWLAEHDMDRQPEISSNHPMKVGVGVYYFEEQSADLEAQRIGSQQ